MAKGHSSTKRLAISKDQANIVIMVAASSAVVVFCLVATRVFVYKMLHQNRVINEKVIARDQLNSNLDELSKLETSYRAFEDAPESVLGTDVSNSKVVLDALPSKYDYAGLLTSVEQIVQNYNVIEVTGIDGILEAEQVSSEPEAIEIPLRIGVQSSYGGIQTFLEDLDRSIRPFNVRQITLDGDDTALDVFVDLVTYYQPEKNLDIGTKEIE